MKFMNCQKVGLSMPKNIIDLLDRNRGDITRSKYIWRILETTLKVNENSDESRIAAQHSSELSNDLNDGHDYRK